MNSEYKEVDLNNPEEIIKTMKGGKPSHLAVLYNQYLKDPVVFNRYFKEDVYNEELQGHPFLYWLSVNVFKWCGCHTGLIGRLSVLYKLMNIFSTTWETYEEKQSEILKVCGSMETFDILMDSFDSYSLFSHGGSNYSSWINYDGHLVKQALDTLFKE